jgi:hypothetical protein
MTLRSRARGEAPAQTPAGAPSPARVLIQGRAGVAATAVSIVTTIVVAALGPSVMEPPLPGRRGQPPWSLVAHPSGYLVVALTAAAIIAGALGLALLMRAARRGWTVSPRLVVGLGLLAAAVLAFLPPFGSSDHLSYAAYGRMLVTGHNPYLTSPSMVARLGDPVAKAVEDWKTSPSVYGVLATGAQAVASLIGGTSVRLTVFVLSLLNLAGFAGTGLLLHRLAGGDRARQFRAALLWTCNPLLLQVLVAGEHVDSQAIVFGVGAVAAFGLALRRSAAGAGARRCLLPAAAAGAFAGLAFAIKLSLILVPVGLAAACLFARPARSNPAQANSAQAGQRPAEGAAGRGTGWFRAPAVSLLAGLTVGFAVVAVVAVAIGGLTSVRSALSAGSYVAIGTPWRWVRAAISLASGETAADDIVKAAAVVAVLALAWLMLHRLPGPARLTPLERIGGPGADPWDAGSRAASLAARGALAFALAWLTAGPYVLPWYDALAWALLPLLPWSAIDWFVLARTTSLAVGYLPARTVAMPAGTGWLITIVRRGVTPSLLLIVAVLLVITLRSQQVTNRAVPATGSA